MTETSFESTRSIGELVGEEPRLARVLESLGIDYCCGGEASLEEACAEEDVAVSEVRSKLDEARVEYMGGDEGLRSMSSESWESEAELVEHIESTHHDYLRDELAALEDLVGKVASVHGENHPHLHEVEEEYLGLAEDMEEHTSKEEDEVFPVIERASTDEAPEVDAGTLRDALQELEDEHDGAAEHLERIRELTDGYEAPDDACASYRDMLHRLERLERDTHRHVHKENNVLFPMAQENLETAA